jgi:hypothetical protein
VHSPHRETELLVDTGLGRWTAAAGKPLRIHVERFNPALRLYERLGFRQIDDRGVYLFLEWRGDNSQRPNDPTIQGTPFPNTG